MAKAATSRGGSTLTASALRTTATTASASTALLVALRRPAFLEALRNHDGPLHQRRDVINTLLINDSNIMMSLLCF
jgi:hypothetical protein